MATRRKRQTVAQRKRSLAAKKGWETRRKQQNFEREERSAIQEEGPSPESLGLEEVDEESLLGRAARFDAVALRIQESIAREAMREMVRIRSRMAHKGRTVAKLNRTEKILRKMYEAYQVGGLGGLERVILREHSRTGKPMRELYTLFFSPEVA